VKIFYILGMTRSGSTILENALGNVPGSFAAGEIHWLWRSLAAEVPCGCGRPIESCEVWGPVLRAAAGPEDQRMPASDVISWQLREARILHTPRLLKIRSWPHTGRSTLDSLLGLTTKLYGALASVTQARVLVDSSKSPAPLEILRHVPEVELYVVHLVRDPRAVAYSWRRGAPNPGGGRSYHPGAVRCSVRWIMTNALGYMVRRRLPRGRSIQLRYEDLVKAPMGTVRRLMEFVGEPEAHLPFVTDRIARLEVNHTVSGNRSRFETGDVEIRSDDEWKTPRRDLRRGIVTLLTLPWLRRYGYRRSLRG
jgi:hypothetical protein